jgi:hypothetical protein
LGKDPASRLPALPFDATLNAAAEEALVFSFLQLIKRKIKKDKTAGGMGGEPKRLGFAPSKLKFRRTGSKN